jgi:hypothetical protein
MMIFLLKEKTLEIKSEGAAMATDAASHRNRMMDLETVHRCRAKLLRAAIGPRTWQDVRRSAITLKAGNEGFTSAGPSETGRESSYLFFMARMDTPLY